MPDKTYSTRQTLLVAFLVSLVCSIFVAAAAVVLEPLQQRNKQQAIRKDILDVAGLLDETVSIEQAFENIETRLVDLATGDYLDGDPDAFDARKAARDPEASIAIPAELDTAQIDRRTTTAKVYLVREDDRLVKIILPVHGYGLWSTMYGFVSVTPDGAEVAAIKFYEHAETPGLGDKIEDDDWRASWDGKRLYDDAGNVALEVIKGNVLAGDPLTQYRIDGLSGATLTGRGVSNTVRYWVGAHGFGPYLERMRRENGSRKAAPRKH